MNGRIRELHEQAFDWVQYQLQTVGSDRPVLQKEQLEMINEKFAELIIRECADVIQKRIGAKSALDVLEHFGVTDEE
jgi:hypothetical protein